MKKNDIEYCDKCGKEIDPLKWFDGSVNYGKIHLGCPAQAFGALCGAKYCAEKEHFDAWVKGHKAMTKNGAQEVLFEWGGKSQNDYKHCYSCQKELLKVIGKFFNYGEYFKKEKGE